jgi:hypothetical protein
MINAYDAALVQIKKYDVEPVPPMTPEIFLYSLKLYKEMLLKKVRIDDSFTSLKIVTSKPLDDLYKLLCDISIVCLTMLSIAVGKSKTEIMYQNRLMFLQKNADYDNSFQDFGLISILIRMNDKINRAITLVEGKSSGMVRDEQLEDTVNDLYNYGVIGLMYKDVRI